MTIPVRARWRAAPAVLRWPILVAIALYASYLVLGNLLLNTPLGPAALNRTPDKFAMHWGPAVTWWPGRLVLWDVALHGQSTRNRWDVSARRMSGQVRLLPLLRRQLLVPHLQVQGVRAGLQAATAVPDAAVPRGRPRHRRRSGQAGRKGPHRARPWRAPLTLAPWSQPQQPLRRTL